MADKIEKIEQPTPNPARPAAADLAKPEPAQMTHHVAAAPVVKVERKPAPPLDERYFEQQEFKQQVWYALIKKETTVDDILRPEFWAYVANKKLSPGNKINAFWEDRSKYLELVVFGVGINWASVSIVQGPVHANSAFVGKSIATDYEIVNLGEIKKWGVVRRSDGHEIKGDGSCRTQEEAQRWLADYLKTTIGQRAA